MTSHDHESPSDASPDSADTASFQEFVNRHDSSGGDSGRVFRLVTLLVGIAVLVALMYLLLF